jgi:argininosuccinate lyase
MQDFKSFHKEFSEDVYGVFNFEASVERRQAIGGTSRRMVERQIDVLRKVLNEDLGVMKMY